MCVGHLSSLLQGRPILKFLPCCSHVLTCTCQHKHVGFSYGKNSHWTRVHSSLSLSKDCLFCIQCWGNGSDGSITLFLFDYCSISLDQNLNSHRSLRTSGDLCNKNEGLYYESCQWFPRSAFHPALQAAWLPVFSPSHSEIRGSLGQQSRAALST